MTPAAEILAAVLGIVLLASGLVGIAVHAFVATVVEARRLHQEA